MRESDFHRLRTVALMIGLVVFTSACDDDEILVILDPANEPPTIITQGPEFPPGVIESNGLAPQPWVLVGDPDGLEDIAAVFLEVDTVRIHEVIIRPDNGDGGCASLDYTPNDIIDATLLIPVPTDLPGLQDQVFTHDEGGIYRPAMFNVPFGVPAIEPAFAAFGPASGCASGWGWLDWFVLLPPAVATRTDVFLTYVEVEFIGTTVTVYDKVGESATTTFPDLRIIYTTQEETTVAP